MITRSDNRVEFHPKPAQEYERKLVSGVTYADWASISELETTLNGEGYTAGFRVNKYFWIDGIKYQYDGTDYRTLGTGGTTANQVEIIDFTSSDATQTISWDSTRIGKFGVFPTIQVWSTETGAPELISVPITADAAPPSTTSIVVSLPGVNGFTVIK